MTGKEDTERTILKKSRTMRFANLYAADISMLFQILNKHATKNNESRKESFNRIVQNLAIAEFGREEAAAHFTSLRYYDNEIDDIQSEFHFRNDL